MTKIKNFLIRNCIKKFAGKLFASFIFGSLCNLAFAPFHFFPAAILSMCGFYFLLENKSQKKKIFWISWFYGFGYFLAGIYWIVISLLVDAEKFAWLIPFGLTLIPGILAMYVGLFGLSYKSFIKRFELSKTYEKILSFAIIWLIFEVLRSFLFSGFPWNLIGYIFSSTEYLIQIASISGIYGLSFLAILICLSPALFLDFDKEKIIKKLPKNSDIVFAIALSLLIISSFIFGKIHIDDSEVPSSEREELRLVQGNIKQDLKWDERQKYNNLMKHVSLTNSASLKNIKAVIWSETSIPYVVTPDSDLLKAIKPAIPENGVLITGGLKLRALEDGRIGDIWNSVFAITNDAIIGSYNKHHLVPFGEYVPLQKYLPFISKITDGAVGFSQGEGPQTIKTNPFSFSPLLCYEVIFTDKIIDKNNRPDLLVNLTNDAWFGNSSGPYQHFDMTKMRAVEYGLPLVRTANSGITAFFDPFGRVIKKIDLNEEGIIDVKMIKGLERTIYSDYASYPLALLMLIIILFLTRKNLRIKNVTR